jgi:hypothetical protein
MALPTKDEILKMGFVKDAMPAMPIGVGNVDTLKMGFVKDAMPYLTNQITVFRTRTMVTCAL